MSVPLTAWPFENIDTTEGQYSTLLAILQENGIWDDPGSGPGQVTAGSGYTLNVASIPEAFIAGAVVQLPDDSTVTVTSPAGTTRIDRVVLRVDWTHNTAVLDVLTGTPGAGSPPALTQTRGGVYELSLAAVTVPASALNITTANIADERLFTSSRVRKWTNATRPNPKAGRFGFNFTTSKLEVALDATDWTPVALEQPKQVATGSVATGWGLSRFKLTKRGARVYIDFSAFRTGGQIDGKPSGNIVNVKVGNVGAWVPSSEWAGLSNGPGGPTCSTAVDKHGDMWLCALPPNWNFTTGTELTAGGSWDTDVA